MLIFVVSGCRYLRLYHFQQIEMFELLKNKEKDDI